jgi:hypothetical protein
MLAHPAREDVVDSYPKPLQTRARVNSATNWVNTGFYRNFGCNFCYPQVLAHLKWSDPIAVSCARGRPGRRQKIARRHE